MKIKNCTTCPEMFERDCYNNPCTNPQAETVPVAPLRFKPHPVVLFGDIRSANPFTDFCMDDE